MIHVLARIQAESGKRAELLAEFHKLVPLVLAESGCIEYGPAVDAASEIDAQQHLGEDTFMVIEKWESLDHLAAHLQAPHMGEYRNKVKDLVAATKLQILKPA